MNVCVDASLVVKWLIEEEGSKEALHLYEKWRKKDVKFISPHLLEYEIGTVLRQKVLRRLLQPEDLFLVFDYYKKLEITLFPLASSMSEAVTVAAFLEQSSIYDVSYLLIAKQQGIEFVTADERFYKAAHGAFSFVKFYKEF